MSDPLRQTVALLEKRDGIDKVTSILALEDSCMLLARLAQAQGLAYRYDGVMLVAHCRYSK
jgi:hypothetical protein